MTLASPPRRGGSQLELRSEIAIEASALLAACRAEEARELLAELPEGPERDHLELLARYALGQPVDATDPAEATRTAGAATDPLRAWTAAWMLAAGGETGVARRLAASAASAAPTWAGPAVLAARLELERGNVRTARARLGGTLSAVAAEHDGAAEVPGPGTGEGSGEVAAARLARAGAALLLPDPPRAALVFSAALDRDPKDPDAWLGLGEARWAAGDRPGAAAAWRRALKQRPDDPELQRRVRTRAVRDGAPWWRVAGLISTGLAGTAAGLALIVAALLLPVALPAEAWIATVLLSAAVGFAVSDHLEDREGLWLSTLPREVHAAVAAGRRSGLATAATTTRVYVVIASVVILGPTLIEVPIRLAQGTTIPGWQLGWFATSVLVGVGAIVLAIVSRLRARTAKERQVLQRLLDAA
jgi:tetratricopeptide (TPR) repeat protein